MALAYLRFVFLIVAPYLLTIAAVPVTQTTTVNIQKHETDMKPTKIPLDVNTSGVNKADLRFSKNSQVIYSGSEKKKKNVKDLEKEFRSCTVSNITYQHREQIPRIDPCEKCVCVDSEMYCFWKLCNFNNITISIPALTIASTVSSNITKQSANDNKLFSNNETDVLKLNGTDSQDKKFSQILTSQRKYNVLKKLELTTTPKAVVTTDTTTTQKTVSTTHEPAVCYVMGVMYKYGEVLPRDTGTCLECSCSEGGRVTCSPKDCVSQPDLDYLSHNNNLDIFDLDTF